MKYVFGPSKHLQIEWIPWGFYIVNKIKKLQKSEKKCYNLTKVIKEF